MFNIYYINYDKALELAMLLDNKIVESSTKEKIVEIGGEGSGSANTETKIPFIDKIIPSLKIEGDFSGTRTKKVVDTIKIAYTKSIILERIIKKTKEIRTINDNKIGNLIKIKNISLRVTNIKQVLGTKALLSGILNRIPIDGIGEVDFTSLANVFLKDSCYILSGKVPEHVNKSEEVNIIFKIPMQAGSELENGYSVSDLEIGPVSIIGIYRGKFSEGEISQKIDLLSGLNISDNEGIDIETDENFEENDDRVTTHFVDIIAVIQELNIR